MKPVSHYCFCWKKAATWTKTCNVLSYGHLSQIGGENVRAALEYLLEIAELEEEDQDMVEFLEEALENLEFNEGLLIPDLFDFEMNDDDDDFFNPTVATGKRLRTKIDHRTFL